MEYSNLFVCLMGVGTVFIGLVCIIFLVSVMSGIVRSSEKKEAGKNSAGTADKSRIADPVVRPSHVPDTVTPELIAAVSAAIAENLGTDVSGIRIVSLKKV